MTDEPAKTADEVPDRFSVDFTGLTLNRVYRVEKKIADGGMGSIYLAEDTNLGRRVVVKVPHPRFLGEPGFRSRFSLEVEELVRLEHPHIARILARGEHDQVPYFVLQYLGGGSLEDRIVAADGRPTDPDGVAGWITDVATTLDFVHEQGLVHRDIKPANILFDEAGNVFLSDFGVAKVVGSDAAITGTGVGIGSPKYMAPEQGMGRAVGPAADQYALAAVVYEVLAGSPPYDGATPIEILVRKGQEPPDALAEKVPDLPDSAAQVVMKGLTKDPSHRYRNCTVFARSFCAGLAEAGIATPERTPLDLPAVPPPRRSRRTHVVVVLAAIALVLALILTRPDGTPDPDPDGGPKVVLLEAGAEPREPLRLVPAADLVQQLRTELVFDMVLTSEGDEPIRIGPTRAEADTEFLVGGTGAIIPFRWQILAAPTPGLVGATANGTMTELGRMTGIDPEGVATEDMALAHIAAMIRQLPVPFPDAPVGIGARWEVTETVRFLGLRMVQTSMFELVERSGTRVKVHVASAATAAPGESLSLGAGPRLDVLSLLTRGEGDVEIDLCCLVPNRSFITTDMDITGRMDSAKGPVERKIEFHVTTRAGPLEEK